MSGPLNLPNQITIARLVMAVVMFVCLSQQRYLAALILFVLAAASDWVDGYLARKHGQITQLGRVLDPFADKIVICGALIYLLVVPRSGIDAWMVIVVVGREMLVSTLRGLIEQQGGDFSASWVGKWKMVAQSAAVIVCLVRVVMYFDTTTGVWEATPAGLDMATTLVVWAAVLLTIYSGVDYIFAAARRMRETGH